jgi:hypothetical protein
LPGGFNVEKMRTSSKRKTFMTTMTTTATALYFLLQTCLLALLCSVLAAWPKHETLTSLPVYIIYLIV